MKPLVVIVWLGCLLAGIVMLCSSLYSGDIRMSRIGFVLFVVSVFTLWGLNEEN